MVDSRLPYLSAGSTAGAYIAKSSILTIASHTLQLYSADMELTGAWNRVRNAVVLGHSQWLNDCLPFMKELF
eukprot:4509455-Amphidinium_carterae.1